MQSGDIDQKKWGLVSTLGAIFLLGGNGYFAKDLELDVLNIIMIRSFIAFLVIYVAVKLFRAKLALNSKQDYLICLLIGVLLGAHWLSFFYSMRVSTVTLGMTALYSYPMMTLILERLFFKKTIPKIDWLLAPLVLVGVWMMGASESVQGADNVLGAVVGVFSALCFAARNLLQQTYLKGYPAHHTIFYQTLAIALVLLPFSLSQTSSVESIITTSHEWWLWIVLGIFFTALPHSLMAFGIQSLGAKSVAFIGCLQPAIGTLIAYLILGEFASYQVFAGAGIVMICAGVEIARSSSGQSATSSASKKSAVSN